MTVFFTSMMLCLRPMTKQSFKQNSVIELPDEVGAHMFSFLTTNELELFGKTNTKTYKNTRAATFLRRVHSILEEHPTFHTFLRNQQEEKKHKKQCVALEGIVAKLSTLDESIVTYNFITSLDTSSLENFNRSIQWMEYYNDDLDWLHLLIPHPNSNIPQLLWTNDEQELVDQWFDQNHNRYEYYLNMGWM